MITLIQGDSLEKLKDLKDNSVDSVVTDPPYGLGKEPNPIEVLKSWIEKDYHEISGSGFMGKLWDAFVPQPKLWKEVFRVLKPGGHLLSFFSTRTFDWGVMALRLAGFEVRDTVMFLHGQGFPKSLNIGKKIDEIQNNPREVLGNYQGPDGNSRHNNKTGKEYNTEMITGFKQDRTITKGNSEWEGWGTQLKPACEPIVLCRKPISNDGIDIAQHICYEIRNQGLINHQEKILWRIKLAKSVDKQKMKQNSFGIQQPKMVVVSVKTVETNEKENIGKKIQKLIEHMQKHGETIILKEQELQVPDIMVATNNELNNIKKNIIKNSEKISSIIMEENVNVVEKQSKNFLPSIISMVEEHNIENHSKMEISSSFLNKMDIQKINTDYCVGTVISHMQNMEIARIIKINYNNKEYEFEQLIDGSFVWNNNILPFINPKHLTVTENVLRYGTGGINIDECRIPLDNEKQPTGSAKRVYKSNQYTEEKIYGNNTQTPLSGRFPSNIIHDGSEEVMDEFKKYGNSKQYQSFRGSGGGGDHIQQLQNRLDSIRGYNDSGTPSRFFYCAKSSKTERDFGLEEFPDKEIYPKNNSISRQDINKESHFKAKNNHPTVKPLSLMEYLCKLITPKNGTALDPFMGSGTTGMACKKLGFNFIGIELEKDYFKIAEKRIEATQEKDKTLFEE